jgi:rhomboid protease GluP
MGWADIEQATAFFPIDTQYFPVEGGNQTQMDLNTILVWLVGIGCAGVIWSGLRRRNRFSMGRAMYAGITLALTLAIYFFRPDLGGLVGLGLFVLLIILPGWGMEWMWQAARAGRFTLVRLLRFWLQIMHPFLEWGDIAYQIQVEEYTCTGQLIQAQQLLQQQASGHTPAGVFAATRLYQLNGDWPGANQWLDSNIDPDLYTQHHELVCLKLRALGEVGALNEMVAFFTQHRQIYQQEPEGLGRALLMIMAFSGRPDTVTLLLEHNIPGLSTPAVKALWQATAHMAAGDKATGRSILYDLPEINDVILQQSIQHRLQRGVSATAADLNPETKEKVNRLAERLSARPVPSSAAFPSPAASTAASRPVVTYLLIALNVLIFLVELSLGGSENALTLYFLGALNPQAVLNGEWWRLLTSMFLHAGLIHIMLNMYILYQVGRFMEFALGPLRYSVLYLLSGLGAGLLLVVLAILGIEPMDLLAVGASGAIMGLIGAETAFWIKVYRQTGAPIAQKRLRSLAFFFIIQTVFDLSTPQVSFPAHFGGLITGFLLGAFLQTGRALPWTSPPANRPGMNSHM